ncbi:MAG: YggS family pyridoxal phosphate enzyme [Verrucomicrobia bacterium RIFCSPHIGHO2_12_FULL_41_10]|nr:MAG: YggS family pyridoxal phosphate enzyme [Verrucomicrobia bacterium RIFCSPHIGHO2_12_FULL_41_10]HLB32647.1 YggS family pyridoxal phosphate-dependent enzyme [Chthoniobacterales bacterium]
MVTNSFSQKQYATVLERIAKAAQRSGRKPSEVELVAVSKTHPAETLRQAMEEGVHLFGESRVQEAAIKIPLLSKRVRWHYIGHLQTNKIRKALPLFELFHSIDSLNLARDMDRMASETGLFPRVLLEVNVSGEGSKYGFSPTTLKEFLSELLTLPRLQVEGFMTMAPATKDPETTRPFFAHLRELRDELALEAGIPFPTLSMGMSNDYEIAIEEGATLVRIGSALFNH